MTHLLLSFIPEIVPGCLLYNNLFFFFLKIKKTDDMYLKGKIKSPFSKEFYT